MSFSIAEGMLAEVVSACSGGAVLTGWALHLGAPPMTIGLVVAAPQLAQVAHLPAAWLTSVFGPRRMAIIAVALSRQALLPLVLLPFVSWSEAVKLQVLGAVIATSAILGTFGNNGWVAWMGDLVPRRVRGRYFGRRTALCTFAGSIAALWSGLALDKLGGGDARGYVLSALALVACVSGAVTTCLMLRQHDVPAPRLRFGLGALAAPLCDSRARRFLAYQWAWNAAVGLAGGFFMLHMLKHLHLGFMWTALHGVVLALMRVVGCPIWGRVIDRFGARPVLTACSFGICVLPMLYLVATPEFLWPLALDAVLSGLLWSGHALALFALPLAIAERQQRPFFCAVSGSVAGTALALGTAAAGWIVEHVPTELVIGTHTFANLQVLFLLSALARFGAASLAPRIVEPGAARVIALVRAINAYRTERVRVS